MSTVIQVQDLCKEFRVALRCDGSPLKKIQNLFVPKYKSVTAVKNVSFSIEKGERVAFIGPNGAGKSTTIKTLTGIMKPTSGSVHVLGMDPLKDRKKIAYHMSAIFGQCSKLWFHLPVIDSLMLMGAIYDLPKAVFEERSHVLISKFNISELLTKPVRQLSLGERMKCELVASLLHNPSVIFLDEPTIGLDIIAKGAIRELLRKLSNEGTTLLLTSHDIGDIESVCDRVILINSGKVVVDTTLVDLKKHTIQGKENPSFEMIIETLYRKKHDK